MVVNVLDFKGITREKCEIDWNENFKMNVCDHTRKGKLQTECIQGEVV